MRANTHIAIPGHLPFLQAICWELGDVHQLTPEEMLNRYERGWRYINVLGNLGDEERLFLHRLAAEEGSWLQADV